MSALNRLRRGTDAGKRAKKLATRQRNIDMARILLKLRGML